LIEFMSCSEFIDHEFLQHAHIDHIEHGHYLPQYLYAELI
jgi:Cft2 family RNA processing exonuclease